MDEIRYDRENEREREREASMEEEGGGGEERATMLPSLLITRVTRLTAVFSY